jgi:hypothetical protein
LGRIKRPFEREINLEPASLKNPERFLSDAGLALFLRCRQTSGCLEPVGDLRDNPINAVV